MGRDLKNATPFMHDFATELIEEAMARMGLKVIIVCVDRLYKEQMAYYARGRRPLDEVNALYKLAGLPPITAIENKSRVTWTMLSKHITNLDDADPGNNLSRAIDFGILDPQGHYMGSDRADINADNIHDYEQLGWLGESIGGKRIKWGGRFSVPDEPHFEEG